MPMKKACPRETCPARPVRMFSPSAAMRRMATSPNTLIQELVAAHLSPGTTPSGKSARITRNTPTATFFVHELKIA